MVYGQFCETVPIQEPYSQTSRKEGGEGKRNRPGNGSDQIFIKNNPTSSFVIIIRKWLVFSVNTRDIQGAGAELSRVLGFWTLNVIVYKRIIASI